MTSEERQVFESAIKTFGYHNQILKAMEECGELINALAKYHQIDQRADRSEVITELADVSIMIDQLAIEFGVDEFKAEREYKVNRLKSRIENGNNECKGLRPYGVGDRMP